VESAQDGLPKPTRDAAQLKRDLDEWGYCLVAEALTRSQIDATLAKIHEQLTLEGRPPRPDDAFAALDQLLDAGSAFHQLVLEPRVSELIAYLLGDDYLLSLFEARGVGPGHGAQALHSDQNFAPGRSGPPLIANALWMLVDFTEENGATRIVPGSHLWDERHPTIAKDASTWSVFSKLMDDLYELDAAQAAAQLERGARGMLDENPKGTVPAIGPAGTALVINAKVIHGAGRNVTSSTVRWTVLTYYCRAFVRQHTNPFLSLAKDTVKDLPPELRRRLGFRPWTLLGRYPDDLNWAQIRYEPGSKPSRWAR
jgi:ectoine hydroxylase-related dioxygenase (phytanoyl-CoA dioxygenase family)